MNELMKLVDVPARVNDLTGASISRQTVYNWASKGRKVFRTGEAVHLKVKLKAGQLFTTEKWVRDFLTKIGG